MPKLADARKQHSQREVMNIDVGVATMPFDCFILNMLACTLRYALVNITDINKKGPAFPQLPTSNSWTISGLDSPGLN